MRERRIGMRLQVGPVDRVRDMQAGMRDRLLMSVRYGGPAAGVQDMDHPFVDVPTPVLCGEPRLESWIASDPVTRFRRGDLAWAEDGQALFGCRSHRIGDDMEQDALTACRDLLSLLDERGYPCLQRIWNYVPGINEDQQGVERYKRFNIGRARGFEERFGAQAERHYSASSAVGAAGDHLIVCFAAAREMGTHLENPRQMSAYHYPAAYGPHSPTFARGTVTPEAWGRAFFLSGTASVVGHRTTHVGDPLGQLDEALANIDVMLQRSSTAPCDRGGRVRLDLLKIYIRHPGHYPAIRDALAARLDPSTPSIYLLADICRANLLLEIEGVRL
ncbi:MAG TPA: pteridine-dependent deoxygenase like protein [Patescibacteria group bacterium]|nr:pteridine-dependent deoxygenase like protein [Patescibacteria group bacterium]